MNSRTAFKAGSKIKKLRSNCPFLSTPPFPPQSYTTPFLAFSDIFLPNNPLNCAHALGVLGAAKEA